jgi:hypothetical protein
LTRDSEGNPILKRKEEITTDGKTITAAGGTVQAGRFLYISDGRLKKNISPLNSSLEKILSLRGVSFDWKSNEKHDVGFIAQEVKRSIPEVVFESNTKKLSVDYSRLVPFLVEAIKKQQDEIDKLKREIQRIKDQ